MSHSHWIFDVYGLPPLTCDGDEHENVEGYVERIKIHQDYESNIPRHYRAKSEPYERRKENSYTDEDFLHRGINSPRQEDRSLQINSPRKSQEEVLKESLRLGLYVNMDQAPSVSKSKSVETTTRNNERVSVAEQILKSKLSQSPDSFDAYRTHLRESDVVPTYRRSDSVDSSKNSQSHTSAGEASQRSFPPSPIEDHGLRNVGSSNYQSVIKSAKSVNKDADIVLNNARDLFVPSNGTANGVTLKFLSNQINSESLTQKYRQEEKKDSLSQTVKASNTKITNTTSNMNRTDDTPPPVPARRDIFSTPQQGRRSPSGPVQNGRGPWSTPQPPRKQYNHDTFRPPMDRQSSVPTTRSRPQSSYENKGLEVESHNLFDEQPRSMPANVSQMTSKPPLPKSKPSVGQQPMVRNDAHFEVKVRPQTALNNRVPASLDNRPLSAGDQSRTENSARSRRSDMGENRYLSNQQRPEHRERNRSTERQGRQLLSFTLD